MTTRAIVVLCRRLVILQGATRALSGYKGAGVSVDCKADDASAGPFADSYAADRQWGAFVCHAAKDA
jgi:hypothetical protein